MAKRAQVAVSVGVAEYPSVPPFHPPAELSDCIFRERGQEENPTYLGIRECFRLAGLDAANYGTPQWNPLGGLIRPRDTVLLKPNLVKEAHPRDPDGWKYV